MSGAISPSEAGGPERSDTPSPARVSGGVHARFLSDGSRTAVASMAERGGYRLARPAAFGAHLDAVLVNTGGGIAGGDRIETVYELGAAADVVHMTPGPELVHRSDGAPARLDVRVALDPGGRLDWLPQQTIVCAGARLERNVEIDAANDSRLLMVDLITFGHAADQQGLGQGSLDDQWRVRRNGRLVHAEAARVSEGAAATTGRSPAGEARAVAAALLVAPEACDLVEPLRRALECETLETWVSACGGILTARALAHAPDRLVAALARAIPVLSGRALPRAWAA